MNRWIHALALQAPTQVSQALGIAPKDQLGRLAPCGRKHCSHACAALSGTHTQARSTA
jgi:hypothetical protein